MLLLLLIIIIVAVIVIMIVARNGLSISRRFLSLLVLRLPFTFSLTPHMIATRTFWLCHCVIFVFLIGFLTQNVEQHGRGVKTLENQTCNGICVHGIGCRWNGKGNWGEEWEMILEILMGLMWSGSLGCGFVSTNRLMHRRQIIRFLIMTKKCLTTKAKLWKKSPFQTSQIKKKWKNMNIGSNLVVKIICLRGHVAHNVLCIFLISCFCFQQILHISQT